MTKSKKASPSKKTSKPVAREASKVLRDPNASKIQKSLAGSALAQSNTNKKTSKKMETVASNASKSKKYNKKTKSLSGSVLSQS